MSWNLENSVVEGLYLGKFPVRGVVDLSRAQHGGEVSHHVALEQPIEVYGNMRNRVILENEFITRVIGG